MNILVIYSDEFQPPTKTHVGIYNHLVNKFPGSDVYIATTSETKYPEKPFSFSDKQQIWVRHGVESDKIVQVKDPHTAKEVISKFGESNTAVIFASTTSFQGKNLKPYPGSNQGLESVDKGGYFYQVPKDLLKTSIVVKDSEGRNRSTILNSNLIKNVLTSQSVSDEGKKTFFLNAFGWYDIALYNLVKNKYMSAKQVQLSESSHQKLKNIVFKIMEEFSMDSNDSEMDSSTDVKLDDIPKQISNLDKELMNTSKEEEARKKLTRMKKDDLRKKKQDLIQKRNLKSTISKSSNPEDSNSDILSQIVSSKI